MRRPSPAAETRRPSRRSGLFAAGLALWMLACTGCSSTGEVEFSAEDYLGILRQLGSFDDAVVKAAWRQIKQHPRGPTVAALQTTLREGEWDLRVKVQIAAILATWPDPQSGRIDKAGLPELIEGLRSPEADLRRIARELLPLFGTEAVPAVADVLASGQKPNREAACEVLGKIVQETQDRGAAEALRGRVMNEDDREIRMLLIIHLGFWESREAVEGFLNALTDPDEGCRQYAWTEIKKRATPPVAFDPRAGVGERSAAIQKLRAWWGTHTSRK